MSRRTRRASARGRPRKFGRPGQVVAVTLPEDVVSGLRKVHPDLGWAIVSLFENRRAPASSNREPVHQDAELVSIAGRRSLIVVNHRVFRSLPGINIVPLGGHRAFLALDPGRGMSDLELAIADKLDDRTLALKERRALAKLRIQLKAWRRDARLKFHSRSIIIVERRRKHASSN